MVILLNDTMIIHNMYKSVLGIDTSAASFDETMKVVAFFMAF